jgi:hypothetical protein
MKTITYKAKAGEHNAIDVNILHGVECHDEFSEYIDESDSFYGKVRSGYMKFVVEDNILYTITTYKVISDLTESEIRNLQKYTSGQWSDGIGEGFEQFPCAEEYGIEIFVSPWYRGQTVETIIE